jgi:hypothetical protein
MLFGPEVSSCCITTGMLIARWTPLRRTQAEMQQPRKSVLVPLYAPETFIRCGGFKIPCQKA